jgi:hypothetical protein
MAITSTNRNSTGEQYFISDPCRDITIASCYRSGICPQITAGFGFLSSCSEKLVAEAGDVSGTP